MSRLIETSTQWGNLYRRRYYINGRRVPEWKFDVEFNTLSKFYDYTTKTERDGTIYRKTWEFDKCSQH